MKNLIFRVSWWYWAFKNIFLAFVKSLQLNQFILLCPTMFFERDSIQSVISHVFSQAFHSDITIYVEATAHFWPKNLEIEMVHLQKLQLEDSGRYKCRVDYFLEQTTFHLIDLKVVVPPQKPKIFLENGLRVNNRLSARLNSSISLKCESIGGFPSPDLTWWLNNRELPSVMFER